MDLNVHPYYDDHEEQYAKKYKQLLFNPGRALQGRELTQLQSLLNDKNSANMNTIFKNGGLVEGCALSLSVPENYIVYDAIFLNADNSFNSVLKDLTVFFAEDDVINIVDTDNNDALSLTVVSVTANKVVVSGTTITDETMTEGMMFTKDENKAYLSTGLIYHNGEVQKVEAQSLVITKSGTEKFGLKVSESVVTYITDDTLTDPASGYDNYNLPGADRLKREWLFVQDDADMQEYFVVVDGVLVSESANPEWNKILQTMAERTYDESGDYIVNGLFLSVLENADSSLITYELSSGRAYIQGYPINLIVPLRIAIDTSQDNDTITNEAQSYVTGTTNYTLYEPYFKSITTVTGTIQVDSIAIVKGSPGTSDDYLDTGDATTYSNITDVTWVSDASDGSAPYTFGDDYTYDGNDINWSPAGTEPSTGATYYARIQYIKVLVPTTDYSTAVNSSDSDYTDLVLTGVAGGTPVNATTMNVTYDYYLARTDIISLNVDGTMHVTLGTPAYYKDDNVPLPIADTLPIGTIKLLPNNDTPDDAEVYAFENIRTTMKEIWAVKKRVVDLEVNQAELALEAEAQDSELPTELRGILVDNFANFKKIDVNSSTWKGSINPIDNELTMEVEYNEIEYDSDNTINDATTTLTTWSQNKFGHLKLTAQTEILDVSGKTDTTNLNPYGYIPQAGIIEISPNSDSWIETEVKNVQTTSSVNVKTITNVSTVNINSGPSRTTSSSSKNYLQSAIQNTQTIVEESIVYAREIDISLTIKDWAIGKVLKVFFDTTQIIPVATGTTTLFDNCLVVPAGGEATATIVVPANTSTGTHTIALLDVDTNITCSAVFNSNGVLKIITKRKHEVIRYQTINTTINYVPRYYYYDGGYTGPGASYSSLGTVSAGYSDHEGPVGNHASAESSCFFEDTYVIMNDGSSKYIKDLKIDDQVQTFNFKENKISSGKVIKSYRIERNEYLKINGQLLVTKTHPFCVGKDEWTNAGDLKIGQKVIGENKLITITNIEKISKEIVVYDITIDSDHNFYVFDNIHKYLVHNKGGCFVADTMVTMYDGSKKPIQEIQAGEYVLSSDNKSKNKVNFFEFVDEPHIYEKFALWAPKEYKGKPFATDSHPFLIDGKFSCPNPCFEWINTEKVTEYNSAPCNEPYYNLWVDGDKTYIANDYGVHCVMDGGILIKGLEFDMITPKEIKTAIDYLQESIEATNGAFIFDALTSKIKTPKAVVKLVTLCFRYKYPLCGIRQLFKMIYKLKKYFMETK